MSKQVQRFSTDVRPAQDDSDSSDPGGTDSVTDKYRREIASRQNGSFVRDAPLFSRTIQASTFSYPATNPIRQKKKLQDIEEKDEVNVKLPVLLFFCCSCCCRTNSQQKRKGVKLRFCVFYYACLVLFLLCL